MSNQEERNDNILAKIEHPSFTTIHYKNGAYDQISNNGAWTIDGSSQEYYDMLSMQFNQLKAKLFNTIEASALSDRQAEALKGIVRGYCNEHFNHAIDDLMEWVRRMGLYAEPHDKQDPDDLSAPNVPIE